jgi:hypothetical protein
MHRTHGISATALALSVTFATLGGCAKHDATPADSAGASAPSTAASTSTMPTDITPVRGALASVSDSDLTVTTAAGDVHVAIAPPLHVFSRVTSDLSHVTAKSFVGVTSEKEADGSQRATEIHIFPEELRGTGEGSYLMTQPGAHDSSRSTMTNGTVQASPKAGGPPRMTNGTIATNDAGKLTVDYHGGSQTITIPPGVSVTAMEAVTTKLTPGVRVVVLAKKQADGTMKASSVVLAAPAAPPK